MLMQNDWRNLLNLYEGKSPYWTPEGLLRCRSLVSLDGFDLLPEGIAKVEKLISGIDELRKGVALKRRIINRREEALKEPWYWAVLRGSEIRFNQMMVMYNGAPGMKPAKATIEQKRYILWIILGTQKKRDVWKKVIPYAVQIDEFLGTEVICFHTLDKKHFWRMQSKYYDLVTSQYCNINWWFRGSGRSGIVAKFKTARTQGLGNYIASIVLPLDPETTLKTPFPDPDIND